jgi:hypothetical protein
MPLSHQESKERGAIIIDFFCKPGSNSGVVRAKPQKLSFIMAFAITRSKILLVAP